MDAESLRTVAEDARPSLPRLELVLATGVVGLFIALGEIDRLIGSFASDGYQVSLAAVGAPRFPFPLPTPTSQPWLTLHHLDAAAHGLVGIYTATDIAMALLYGFLRWRLLRRLLASGAVGPEAPLQSITRPRPMLAIAAAAADGVEDLILLALALTGGSDAAMPSWLATAALAATSAKWLLLLLAVAPLAFAVVGTSKGRAWSGRWLRALAVQRFSLLAVVPIAALALVPGPGVFDQLPDVQRAWLEVGGGRGWSGPLNAAWAIVLLGIVAAGLFVLGRLLTDDALRRSQDPRPRPPTLLRQWLFGPVVLAALAIWSVASGGHLLAGPLLLFGGIPLAVAGASWVLRRHFPALLPGPPGAREQLPVSEIWGMGDMLALCAVVVASLGIVRSHTVLLVALQGNPVQWTMPLLGLVAGAAAWWWGVGALERSGSWIPLIRELISPAAGASLELTGEDAADGHAPRNRDQRGPWLFGWLSILLSTEALVVLAVWPAWVSSWAGVLGVMMFALGNLTLLIGASVAVNAFWAPPEVFWLRGLRLREAPVGTLVLATVLAAALAGSTPEVHGVRSLAATPPPGIGYDRAVAQWRARTGDCLITLPDGTRARPMLFVAAEGGGIRAAYWTAAALDALPSCAVDAVAFASGVSGGSVGLAVARVTGVGSASEAVWAMSDGQALSEATLGLLVRDPAYTVAGLPATVDSAWLDRAGLMETAWERAVPGLAGDFYAQPAPGGLAAPLILNSTDATSGCRVLATQLEVDDAAAATAPCTSPGAPLPYSRDLRAYIGREGDVDETCLAGVRLSTAAMLSARFPFVTPSGVTGPCRGAPRAQLIDGGYAEGSGLGTLVDVAPRFLAQVSGDGVPVQPIVVFLHNGTGGDLTPVRPETRPEVLVPLLGSGAAGGTQRSAAAWLQRAQSLSGGRAGVLPTRVHVVAPGNLPGVQAPLGWLLSQSSRAVLDRSFQSGTRCEGSAPEVPHPGLGELLTLFGECK